MRHHSADDKCPVFSSQLRITRISKTQRLLGNLLPCCLASCIIVTTGQLLSEATVSSNPNRVLCSSVDEKVDLLSFRDNFLMKCVLCCLLSQSPDMICMWCVARCPVASTGGPHPSYSDSSSRVTELNAETDTYKLKLIFTPANSSMSPMSLNYSKLSCFNCGKMSWFSIMINLKTHVKRCKNNVL